MSGWYRLYLIAVLGILLFITVSYMPAFGSFQNRNVAFYYLENVWQDTGSANAVNAIVWDYRGYDTLGEETVLFAAALAVFLIIRKKEYHKYGPDNKKRE